MPWHEVTIMSQRLEFVLFATQPDANIAVLCRRFGISRKTGYKWLARAQQAPADGDAAVLADRPRRPHTCPTETSPPVVEAVCAVRHAHPAWGGRKIAAWLQQRREGEVPAPSTITDILRRAGLLDPATAAAHTPYQRFERDAPNALWQMDFKGHHPTASGRSHPLTVLDDHSRFNLVLCACPDETTATVQAALCVTFARYGLPEAILTDNGPPWGDGPETPYTRLGVWLLRLGIQIRHGRPYHPQTQGKDERFHRTFKAEVLQHCHFADLADCQRAYDEWRDVYNLERPHEALGLQPPITRYRPSPRAYPADLPPIEYGPDDAVRRVQQDGTFSFQGRQGKVAKAFVGQPIAIRLLDTAGQYGVYFCRQQLTVFSLTDLPKGS